MATTGRIRSSAASLMALPFERRGWSVTTLGLGDYDREIQALRETLANLRAAIALAVANGQADAAAALQQQFQGVMVEYQRRILGAQAAANVATTDTGPGGGGLFAGIGDFFSGLGGRLTLVLGSVALVALVVGPALRGGRR